MGLGFGAGGLQGRGSSVIGVGLKVPVWFQVVGLLWSSCKVGEACMVTGGRIFGVLV